MHTADDLPLPPNINVHIATIPSYAYEPLQESLRSKALKRIRNNTLGKCFVSWADFCEKRKAGRNQQRRAARIIQRADQRATYAAFSTWVKRYTEAKRSRFLLRRALAKIQQRRKSTCFTALLLATRRGVSSKWGSTLSCWICFLFES